MKKSVLFLASVFICFSFNSFGQKFHTSFHSHNQFSNHQTLDFAGGMIAGFFLNEIFGLSNNNRQMYFAYTHNKNKWRLKKDVCNNNNVFYSGPKIIARFENPNGGKDFFVKINRRGEWIFNCPKRFKKILKNKVRRNL
jgi:hypothetical protein